MLRGVSRARTPRLASPSSSRSSFLPLSQRSFAATRGIRANELPKTPLTPASSPAHPPSPSPTAQKTQHSPISPTSANPPTAPSTTPPLPPPSPPPEKPRRLLRPRNIVILLLLSALGYGGALWYSFRSDNFHDFFTEYVPGAQKCVHLVQDYEYQQRYPGRPLRKGEKTSDLGGKGPHISALRANRREEIEKKQDEIKKIDEDAKKLATEEKETKETSSIQLVPKVEQPPKRTAEPTAPSSAYKESPTEPKPAPLSPAPEVKSESAAAEPSQPSPPRLEITLLDISPNDEVIEKLTTSLNNLIKSFNAAETCDPRSGRLYEFLKSHIAELNDRIPQIISSSRAEAEAQVQAQARYFAQLHDELKAALLEERNKIANEWMAAFDKERDVLQERYNERLTEEIKKTGEVNDARLESELLEQAIVLRRRWIREIQSQVEQERGGRLGKLADLEKQLGELLGLHRDSHAIFARGEKAKKTAIAIQALKDAALTRGGGFVPEVAALKSLSGNDDLVQAIISSIDPDAYTHGVASLADLASRFQHLSTELRKIALLPPDAGVAGHAASWLLSKFMFRQRGYVRGHDVDSRLARIEALLEGGQLEDATREVNSFEGWGRDLSQDWLRDARKRLEVCQAIEVLETEVALEALESV